MPAIPTRRCTELRIRVRTDNWSPQKTALMKLFRQPGSDALMTASDRTIFNILLTGHWLQGEINRALAPHKLTLTQYNVLCMLEQSDTDFMTSGEFRRMMPERDPDLTRLLRRMESRELVDVRPSRHDARVREVRITATGRALAALVAEDADKASRKVMRRLSIDERHVLSDLLERLREE